MYLDEQFLPHFIKFNNDNPNLFLFNDDILKPWR